MVSWSNLEKLCSCSKTWMVSALACGNKWIQGGTYTVPCARDSVTRACTDSLGRKPLQLRNKSTTLSRAWVVIVWHFNHVRRGGALAAISGKAPSVSGVWIYIYQDFMLKMKSNVNPDASTSIAFTSVSLTVLVSITNLGWLARDMVLGWNESFSQTSCSACTVYI